MHSTSVYGLELLVSERGEEKALATDHHGSHMTHPNPPPPPIRHDIFWLHNPTKSPFVDEIVVLDLFLNNNTTSSKILFPITLATFSHDC